MTNVTKTDAESAAPPSHPNPTEMYLYEIL